MKKTVALLRGINVGGKNQISMPALKAVFEECGFAEVRTYINSGNILFLTGVEDELELKRMCEASIKDKFSLDIPVAICSGEDLSEALRNAPDWWDADRDSKHNAIFVIQPATAEDIMEKIGDAKPEYEKVGFYGRIIFWSAPLKTFSRTRYSKIVGTAAYDSVTIRNANTAKKLSALVEGE